MMRVDCDGIAAFGRSLKGYRHKRNDDRFIIKDLNSGTILMAVSDGMGGHPGGDIAAEDVIGSLDLISDAAGNEVVSIHSAIDRADVIIRNRVRKSLTLEGMGATVTAAILNRQKLWWGHVGDSRLYLLRNNHMCQITKDHSFLHDFIEDGEISEEEALSHPMAHVLDQCVGCIDAGADHGSFDVKPGDYILLNTDGLFRVLSDHQIVSTVSSSRNVTSVVDKLLTLTADNCAPDDTTVVMAHIYDAS